MIIKVQLPLRTTAPEDAGALLYNRDKSVMTSLAISKPLLARMKNRVKVFFHADIVNGSVEIGEEASWQDW